MPVSRQEARYTVRQTVRLGPDDLKDEKGLHLGGHSIYPCSFLAYAALSIRIGLLFTTFPRARIVLKRFLTVSAPKLTAGPWSGGSVSVRHR